MTNCMSWFSMQKCALYYWTVLTAQQMLLNNTLMSLPQPYFEQTFGDIAGTHVTIPQTPCVQQPQGAPSHCPSGGKRSRVGAGLAEPLFVPPSVPKQ